MLLRKESWIVPSPKILHSIHILGREFFSHAWQSISWPHNPVYYFSFHHFPYSLLESVFGNSTFGLITGAMLGLLAWCRLHLFPEDSSICVIRSLPNYITSFSDVLFTYVNPNVVGHVSRILQLLKKFKSYGIGRRADFLYQHHRFGETSWFCLDGSSRRLSLFGNWD